MKKWFLLAALSFHLLASVPSQASVEKLVRMQDGSLKKVQIMSIEEASVPATGVATMKPFWSPKTGVPANLPLAAHVRNVSPVLDQGQRNVCSFFATVGLLETYLLNHPISSATQVPKLSEECFIGLREWMYQTHDQGPDHPVSDPENKGDAAPYLARTISRIGIPKEDRFPNFDCHYQSDEDHIAVSQGDYEGLFASQLSPAYGKGVTVRIVENPSVDELKAKIAAGIPVIANLYVFSDFFDQSDWRHGSWGRSVSDAEGAHAIIVTGYETTDSDVIFKFRNSWGDGWGDQGYGTVDFSTLQNAWTSTPGLNQVISFEVN
jgi:C1A family cysteine protease